MKSSASPYEVRCPRCDVTFPIETKRCIHCGGPTTGSGIANSLDSVAIADSGGRVGDPYGLSQHEAEDAGYDLPEYGSDEREIEQTDEPTSVAGSLIRSLGGFIWIIVLIGFTLARNCGGE